MVKILFLNLSSYFFYSQTNGLDLSPAFGNFGWWQSVWGIGLWFTKTQPTTSISGLIILFEQPIQEGDPE